MTHELPQLPYALDALAPQISKETLEYHYGKHHKAYVDKLNELIVGTKFERMTLDEIVAQAEPGPLFNNAAQAWNHTFYFMALGPLKSKPGGDLAKKIDTAWGSFDAFKEAFVKAGVGQFGSGWVWLVEGQKGLEIVTTANAGRPTGKLLMVLDVWEHAYYIDYRNRRPDHLSAAFDRINWAVVQKR